MSIELEKECYTTLKAEFTQIFSSFRLLMLYQIGGFAILFFNCISQKDTTSLLLTSLLSVLLTYVIHIIGSNWIMWALRQVAFTFVNYEIPLLKEYKDADKEEYRKKTSGLWILANRAESRFSSSASNSYKVGSEIEIFYCSQMIYLAISFVITIFKCITIYLYPSDIIKIESGTIKIESGIINNDISLLILNISLGVIYIICFLIFLRLFYKNHIQFTKRIGMLTTNWNNYFHNKKIIDKEYIDSIPFQKQHGVNESISDYIYK
jgi:hypothetical protein